jgi:hypothetical protein
MLFPIFWKSKKFYVVVVTLNKTFVTRGGRTVRKEAYAIEQADGTNALEFGPSSSAPLHTMQASLTLRYLARIGA